MNVQVFNLLGKRKKVHIKADVASNKAYKISLDPDKFSKKHYSGGQTHNSRPTVMKNSRAMRKFCLSLKA